MNQHLAKVFVLGLTVALWGEETVVDRVEVSILPAGMHQIHHADAANQTMNRAAVLKADHLDLRRIPLVLNTVIRHKIRIRAVDQERRYRFP